MTTKNVVVFSSPTWGSCKAVKEFLTAKGVPFTNRDISVDEKAMEDLEKAAPGAASIPVILVDNEVIMGFDRTKLQKALELQWCCSAKAASGT